MSVSILGYQTPYHFIEHAWFYSNVFLLKLSFHSTMTILLQLWCRAINMPRHLNFSCCLSWKINEHLVVSWIIETLFDRILSHFLPRNNGLYFVDGISPSMAKRWGLAEYPSSCTCSDFDSQSIGTHVSLKMCFRVLSKDGLLGLFFTTKRYWHDTLKL